VEALGLAYLQKVGHLFHQGQSLVIGGCFSAEAEMSAWVVCGGETIPQPKPKYSSNSPEGDMRLWRHALQSNEQRVLIYSPDTDVYNIGLSLIHTHPDTDFILQLNVPYSEEKYLSLNSLEKALRDDPDLATLPQNELHASMHCLRQLPYHSKDLAQLLYKQGLDGSHRTTE